MKSYETNKADYCGVASYELINPGLSTAALGLIRNFLRCCPREYLVVEYSPRYLFSFVNYLNQTPTSAWATNHKLTQAIAGSKEAAHIGLQITSERIFPSRDLPIMFAGDWLEDKVVMLRQPEVSSNSEYAVPASIVELKR
jgi:hypothetical protein